MRSSTPSRQRAAPAVSAYLASLPARTRRELGKLREAIRSAAPDATEELSYGIPAFRLDDRPLVYCAAWTHHTSLYPMTAAIRRAHAAELRGYATSAGTVRFPLAEPIPVSLVRRLVTTRIAQMRGSGPSRRRSRAGRSADPRRSRSPGPPRAARRAGSRAGLRRRSR